MQLITNNKRINNARTKYNFIKLYFEEDCPATFYKETNHNQCSRARSRTFKDLYYLTKTRFKSTTRLEVVKILHKLGSKEKLDTIPCPNIQNLVFAPKVKEYWSFYNFKLNNRLVKLHGEEYKDKEYKDNNQIVTFNRFLNIIEKNKFL